MKYYSRKYDAYFDDEGIWLEKKCADSDCEFCKDRPETASKEPKLFETINQD